MDSVSLMYRAVEALWTVWLYTCFRSCHVSFKYM